MIAGLFAWLSARRWPRAVQRCGPIVAAVLLFLLSIRRAGERTGRLLEGLETMEKTNDVQRDMLEGLRLAGLAIVVSLLAGCGTVPSDDAPCPQSSPTAGEYVARAAGEFERLPFGSAIEHMLADHQVMRDQARACERNSSSGSMPFRLMK